MTEGQQRVYKIVVRAAMMHILETEAGGQAGGGEAAQIFVGSD